MMIDIARYSSPFNDPLNSFTQTLEKSDGHLESKKEELLFKIIEAEKKLEAKIQSKKDEARQRELSKPKGPCVRCGRLTQYNCSYCENFLCSDCGSFCSDDCDYYFYYSD
jgi:hypothetical protein